MPVITRSQSKKQHTVSHNTESHNTESHNTESQKPLYESSFYHVLMAKQIEQIKMTDSTAQMNCLLDIYRIVNQGLDKVIQLEGISKWMPFVVSVLKKSNEFQIRCSNDCFNHIDSNIVKNFISEINKSCQICINIIHANQ